MNWDDTGYLISKNKYNENSVIADFLQKNMENVLVLSLELLQKKLKTIYRLVINFI